MDEAEVITIADYVASVLQTVVNEASPPDATVQRAWELTHDLGTIEGRKIDVYGVGYADGGPITRSESFYDVTVIVVIINRYDGDLTGVETAGMIPHIPTAWVDEQIRFVEQKVFTPLGTVTEDVLDRVDGNPLKLGNWWTETLVVNQIADIDFLRQMKVFWSEVEITFRRVK